MSEDLQPQTDNQADTDREPAFGTRPITDEALHEWMQSGHGQPEPENISIKEQPAIEAEVTENDKLPHIAESLEPAEAQPRKVCALQSI
jgi:hypothetical protein